MPRFRIDLTRVFTLGNGTRRGAGERKTEDAKWTKVMKAGVASAAPALGQPPTADALFILLMDTNILPSFASGDSIDISKLWALLQAIQARGTGSGDITGDPLPPEHVPGAFQKFAFKGHGIRTGRAREWRRGGQRGGVGDHSNWFADGADDLSDVDDADVDMGGGGASGDDTWGGEYYGKHKRSHGRPRATGGGTGPAGRRGARSRGRSLRQRERELDRLENMVPAGASTRTFVRIDEQLVECIQDVVSRAMKMAGLNPEKEAERNKVYRKCISTCKDAFRAACGMRRLQARQETNPAAAFRGDARRTRVGVRPLVRALSRCL